MTPVLHLSSPRAGQTISLAPAGDFVLSLTGWDATICGSSSMPPLTLAVGSRRCESGSYFAPPTQGKEGPMAGSLH